MLTRITCGMRSKTIVYPAALFVLATVILGFSTENFLLAQTQNDRQIQRAEPQATRQASNRRVALVIGNAKYTHVSPLVNPVNDSTAMATALQDLRFDRVISVKDANLRQMEQAVDDFYEELLQGSIGVFYYAGHGVQSEGENYLIPVDANIVVEGDLKLDTLPLARILNRMYEAGNDVNIVILDACRDNPFATSWRSTSRGLAFVNAPSGVLIAYSTSPGNVAADGDRGNGTYTEALLNHIRTHGLKIEDLFKNVRIDVKIATSDRQIPWESTSLTGYLAFNPTENQSEVPTPQSRPTPNPTSRPVPRPTPTPVPPQTPRATPSAIPATPRSTPQSTGINNANPSELARGIPLFPGEGQDVEAMYARLDAYAAAGEWRKADQQNLFLMSQISKQNLVAAPPNPALGGLDSIDWDYLGDDQIRNFPCPDLQRMDQIWATRSNGKFGYSAQQRVILANGDTPEDMYYNNNDAYERFATSVGWKKKKGGGFFNFTPNIDYGLELIETKNLDFTLNAPDGHLPIPRMTSDETSGLIYTSQSIRSLLWQCEF